MCTRLHKTHTNYNLEAVTSYAIGYMCFVVYVPLFPVLKDFLSINHMCTHVKSYNGKC